MSLLSEGLTIRTDAQTGNCPEGLWETQETPGYPGPFELENKGGQKGEDNRGEAQMQGEQGGALPGPSAAPPPALQVLARLPTAETARPRAASLCTGAVPRGCALSICISVHEGGNCVGLISVPLLGRAVLWQGRQALGLLEWAPLAWVDAPLKSDGKTHRTCQGSACPSPATHLLLTPLDMPSTREKEALSFRPATRRARGSEPATA